MAWTRSTHLLGPAGPTIYFWVLLVKKQVGLADIMIDTVTHLSQWLAIICNIPIISKMQVGDVMTSCDWNIVGPVFYCRHQGVQFVATFTAWHWHSNDVTKFHWSVHFDSIFMFIPFLLWPTVESWSRPDRIRQLSIDGKDNGWFLVYQLLCNY